MPLFLLAAAGVAFLLLSRPRVVDGGAPSSATDTGEVDNAWGHLDPTFEAALRAVFADLEAEGWGPVLFEGYRSPERQAALKASGSSTVSWSFHNFERDGAPASLAADVIDSIYGWDSDEFFAALQAAAEARGMESGNGWSWRDAAHVQAAPSSVLSAVASGTVDVDSYLASLVTS